MFMTLKQTQSQTSPDSHGKIMSPPIVIVAATETELRSFFPFVDLLCERANRIPTFDGRTGSRDVVLASTGVGKANAALTTFWLLEEQRHAGRPAQLVVQTGCCGAFPDSGLETGDVVIGTRAIFADEGVTTPTGFLDMRTLGLPLAEDHDGNPVFNEIPLFTPALEISSHEADVRQALPSDLKPPRRHFNLKRGPIATISTCSGSDRQAAAVSERWRPLAESMEGAATALAALRAGCPCMEVRGVSNRVGDRDRAAWDIDRACANAASTVAAIIGNLEVGSRKGESK